jgi:hypothetical protein
MKLIVRCLVLAFGFYSLNVACSSSDVNTIPKEHQPVCVKIDTNDIFTSKTVDANMVATLPKRTQKYILRVFAKDGVKAHVDAECLPSDLKLNVHLVTLGEASQTKEGAFNKVTTKYSYKIKYEAELLKDATVVWKRDNDDNDESLDELLESIGKTIAEKASAKIRHSY